MKKLVAIAAVLGLAATAQAGPWGKGMMGKGGPGMGPPPAVMNKFLKDIGVSPQVIKKLKNLHYDAQEKSIDIRAQVQKARLELMKLLDTPKPSRSAVFSQLEKISRLELEMKKLHVGMMLDVKSLLTPEQFEKLQAFHAEWKAKHRRGKGRRGRGPRGGPGAGPMP